MKRPRLNRESSRERERGGIPKTGAGESSGSGRGRSKDTLTRRLAAILTTVAAVNLAAAEPAPRIRLEEFRIEPVELKLGGAFTLHARAVAAGVKVGSFLLRTAGEVKKEDSPPGFPLHASGMAYVAEDGKYHLMDNGKLDRDPREGAFAVEVSTRGWKEGQRAFAFFASNRPAPGPFTVARRDFMVVVKSGRVLIEDMDDTAVVASREIAAFSAEPRAVEPGGKVAVRVALRGTMVRGVQLTNPYYIAAGATLAGFRYDEAKKKSFYGSSADFVIADNGADDKDAGPQSIGLELDTSGWPAGVHHLVLNAVSQSNRVLDCRNFAIQVLGPRDQFRVTVEPSVEFGPGTHSEQFLALRDGALLYADKFSTDGGRTWQGKTGGFGVGGTQLADGRAIGMDYRCLPIEGREGWYRAARFISSDHGRQFAKSDAEFHVPEAKAAQGHGFHRGPLFMRSVIERADGSLVAFMAGWFKSDTALCPYGRGRPYSRSYVCESGDGGKTWRYLATVGYAHIGSEGFNEGSMRRLPNGEWLAVLRTGNANDIHCQDNPIMWGVSRDEGRSWSEPARTGVQGAFPSLAVQPDGVIVMSYGRPGAMVVFSSDNGRTWTDPVCVDATPYSGYTSVASLGPGELLVAFGAQHWLDSKTGKRENLLRLARVRYERKRQP